MIIISYSNDTTTCALADVISLNVMIYQFVQAFTSNSGRSLL